MTGRFDTNVNVDRPREGAAVVELVGEHDLTTAQETASLLAELVRDNELVVVDLCSTTFMDSSILSCLVVAGRDAKELDHEFRLLVSDAPSVAAVLKVTGIDELLTVIIDREEI
jgi:anti-anti-sigma factor